MFRIDHHIHTSRYSPDSSIDPMDLVRQAGAVGMDGVVITEHDCMWPEDELRDLSARANGLLVLAGVEVSAMEGHFLVYGLRTMDDVYAGIPLDRLMAVAKRQDAAIVAAHPYRWDQDFDEIADRHGHGIDALELVSNNVTPHTRALAERLLTRRPMGTTGSSDAHIVEVIGCYYTEFSNPIHSIAEFVNALRARMGRPGHRSGIRLASGPAR